MVLRPNGRLYHIIKKGFLSKDNRRPNCETDEKEEKHSIKTSLKVHPVKFTAPMVRSCRPEVNDYTELPLRLRLWVESPKEGMDNIAYTFI